MQEAFYVRIHVLCFICFHFNSPIHRTLRLLISTALAMGMGGAPMRMNGVPPTNAPQRVPIDPALDPLPGPSRANSAAAQGRPTSAALTEKVAGARRKGKGCCPSRETGWFSQLHARGCWPSPHDGRGQPTSGTTWLVEGDEGLQWLRYQRRSTPMFCWFAQKQVHAGMACIILFLNLSDMSYSLHGQQSQRAMAIAPRKSSGLATSMTWSPLVLP